MQATPDKPTGITLKITSCPEQVSLLCEALHALCLHASGNENCALDMQRAAVEALNNVVVHAYHNKPGHEITVHWFNQGRQLRIEIIDCGSSMAFLPEPVLPDFTAEGGRGWWIINSCLDDYFYKIVEYVEQEHVLRHGDNTEKAKDALVKSHNNILTLIKHF